ncbi:hypothetical protein FQN54_009276 [Arachnomyces sp. PD_36]|nr:hypothetical protein FQN54_009276 [Arachnomyces sp. PD_36]
MVSSRILEILLFCTLFTTVVLSKQPNVVFILTDDQDAQMGSLSYMPSVKKHLLDQGTQYERHFCTVALCCPSRVSLLTGRAAHNTNVTDVWPPYGGYSKFVDEGLNEQYLPVWLQEAGYNTYYTGKLMNHHHILNYFRPFPAGWTSSDFLLDPFTYSYMQSVWQRDKEFPVSAAGQHTTDVITEKALGYIEEGSKSDSPFFLTVAPIAPHADVTPDISQLPELGGANPGSIEFSSAPPVPLERHQSLFQDVIVPRTPNFNPNEPSGVSWVSQLPKQNQTVVDYNDEFYRNRLRALQGIDEMVETIFQRLAELGILDNTYVVYASDNGYHIGQHRLYPGKECGFEEDINVPLVIRGPNVPRGESTDIVTTHTDLAPTFFNMLGIDPRPEFDGSAIPFTQGDIAEAEKDRHEHVNVEHWGTAGVEGMYGKEHNGEGEDGQPENTYKALRLVSKDYNLYYSVYCNNERELYNMAADPYQIDNLMSTANSTTLTDTDEPSISDCSISEIVPRLDALLMVLKTCKAQDCIDPWAVLHPKGDVKSLEDALNPRYDDFYRESYETNAVSFSKCEPGQVLSSEGPLEPLVYHSDLGWSAFV